MVILNEDVEGNIRAGGYIECEDVDGDIEAGDFIKCRMLMEI